MMIPFLSPARCVLLISDDSLHVYNVRQGRVFPLETVEWTQERFEEHVADLIQKKGKGAVVILNDMTDQHFKGGQRIPKVGALDQARVVTNRLRVAFPNYPIRGALLMKEKGRRGEAASAAGNGGGYLFAAVAVSDPVRKTMEAVKMSAAAIEGFFLLPVEAASMVSAIVTRAPEPQAHPARWVVFIGQHENGALRQVITRDGQLAMTRMTPAQVISDDYVGWARQVQQEFKATVSYLSRFGFSAEEGVDFVVITHPEAGKALENMLDIPCRFLSYTANQAATLLNLKPMGQSQPYFAENLHVAWCGSKTRFTLPMVTGILEKIKQARQMAQLASVLLLGGVAFLGWMLFSSMQETFTMEQNMGQQKKMLAQVDREYQAELDRLQGLGLDVKRVQAAVLAYNSFEADRIKILSLVQGVQRTLGGDLRLDDLRIEQVEDNTRDAAERRGARRSRSAPEAEKKGVEFAVSLTLSFPSTIDPEVAVKEVNDFSGRLGEAFPDYKVSIVRNVIGLDYSAEFSGAAGVTAQDVSEEDYVAEIKIEGNTQ